MYFHNPDKNISKWLDKTLISRSKSKEDVDDADPKPGEEPEPESEKEPEEDISRSKPEQDVDEVDYTEGKEPEEDTQQPSNFLSSIIFPAIKSIQLNPLLILSHHSFHGYLGLKRKNNLITILLCLTYQKNNPMIILLCLSSMLMSWITTLSLMLMS